MEHVGKVDIYLILGSKMMCAAWGLFGLSTYLAKRGGSVVDAVSLPSK